MSLNYQQINSRQDLIDYCLRKCGAPVIEINVADEQIEDRINDALSMFFQYNMNGSTQVNMAQIITQQDIDNKYFTLPDNVLTVSGIVTDTSQMSTEGTNLQIKAYFSDLISRQGLLFDSSSYVITKSYLSMFNDILGTTDQPIYTWNQYNHKLIPQWDWSHVRAGKYLAYESYVTNNDVAEIYSDYWLREYAWALIMQQWGYNLSIVDNMMLPGGGTIQGSKILEQGNKAVEELEQKLKDEYTYPVMAFMG